jgi:hypothetical protein
LIRMRFPVSFFGWGVRAVAASATATYLMNVCWPTFAISELSKGACPQNIGIAMIARNGLAFTPHLSFWPDFGRFRII